VYEQAAQLGEVGAGITLSPNSSRVLQHLGLGDAIARMGFSPGKQWTQNWRTGDVILEFERGPELSARYGAPYVHIHRADLHGLLVDALREAQPDAIALGHRLIEVEADGNLRFANGHAAQADVVVGADGLHSVVRRCLFGDVRPAFTGQVAWRGIVPAERLPDGTRGMTPGIHVGPGRLFMRYPVRHGALLNYAAFVELEGWEEESWSIPSTIEELLGHFEGWHETVRRIIAATPENQIYKWALHTREPLPTWIAGRVTLLGDAAHAMLPFMGQGAATAVEDGMVLARCLASFEAEEALRRYEAARLDRTTMVQTQSRLLGMKFQGKDPDALGRGPVQNEESLGLFAYDAVNVPI
jgi:salicylate hydroxylase